ncbi:10037_t:CDS:2 [Ambispora leptoticha]|uniref:10037_t:CDS:1 n=1 Tax=Ambispora leptoticha TaxID=144679 RepID=A0A9N9B5I1_9GLOM|nr:10037_t:CDS:2 [Ambispora leptoticha]
MASFELARDSEFYSVTITSTILQTLNLLGAAYVFYRSFLHWRAKEYGSLAMTHRLPLYAASTDFFNAGLNIINAGYTLCNAKTLPEVPCAATGWMTAILSFINQFLFLGISLVTYLRICQHKTIDLGRFDYKLISFSLFIAGFIIVIVSRDGYGAQKYWCAQKAHAKISLIIPLVEISLVALISLFCYVETLRTLLRNRKELNRGTSSNAQRQRYAQIEERVTRKIITYVLFFNLQWLPIVVYAGAALLQPMGIDTWVYLVGVIGLSFGGIGNAIAYVLNEGWDPNRQGSTSRSQKFTPPTNNSPQTTCNELLAIKVDVDVDVLAVKGIKDSF